MDLYDKTIEKKRYLENLGYTYQSIWESDFDKPCQDNPNMKSIIESLDFVTPLEPRDAFYGGRTEAYSAPSIGRLLNMNTLISVT